MTLTGILLGAGALVLIAVLLCAVLVSAQAEYEAPEDENDK